MHQLKTFVAFVALLALVVIPAGAAQKGSKGPRPVKSSSVRAPKVTKTSKAPKLTAPKGGPKATAPKGGPKATTVTTKAAKADAKLARSENRSANAKKADVSATTTTSTASSGVLATESVDFTSGKVGERLLKNSALRSKLEAQLLALGYEGTVYEAGYGFKNVGQLQAALNNAQNQALSFEQLKIQMTGISVDPEGHVLHANLNPDGTVTMVPADEVTNPAPTQSLGQAKQTVGAEVPEAETTEAGL
jgi:hypothetical protein